MKIIADKPMPIVHKTNSDQQSSASSDSVHNAFTDMMKSVNTDQKQSDKVEMNQNEASAQEDQTDEDDQAQLLASLGLAQDLNTPLLKENNTALLPSGKNSLIETDASLAARNANLKPGVDDKTQALGSSNPLVTQPSVEETTLDKLPQMANDKSAQNSAVATAKVSNQDIKQNPAVTQQTTTYTSNMDNSNNDKGNNKNKENPVPNNQSLDAMLNSGQSLIESSAAANKLDKQKTDTSKSFGSDMGFNAQIQTPISSEQPSSITLLSPSKDLALNSDNAHMKYANALAQMGGIINAHTNSVGGTNPSQQISQTTSRTDFAESLRQAQQSGDYEVNVEMTPASSGAISKDVYNAKIKIYPPELGHITAKLKVDKNSTELVILTENNHVKNIVESNLAQLKDSFAKSDINLTTVHVDTANSQATSNGQNKNNNSAGGKFAASDDNDLIKKQPINAEKSNKSSDKIVDTYA